jgi:DNA-binding transcriptional LysR family regulator
MEYRQCICIIFDMPPTHQKRLDLNLLLALDALLQDRSVTRAAQRVGLTQPSMSRALGRLRATLGDALFVRSGRGLVPTPRALALQAELRGALERLATAVEAPKPFDPATADRTFHVSTADYGMAILVPLIAATTFGQAARVRLVLHAQSAGDDEALLSGHLDVLLAPRRPSSPGTVWTKLFSDEFVCLVRRDHPTVGVELSLAEYMSLGHVFVSPALATAGVADQALARRGLRRRVAVVVPSFLIAPVIASESDFVATVPSRIATLLAGRLPVRSVPVPLELPPVTLSMAWHERMRRDPAHTWFRRLLVKELGRGG